MPSPSATPTPAGSLYYLARTPSTDEERAAAWWGGGVREHDAPRRTTRLHRVDLATGNVVTITPEHLHVEDFAVGVQLLEDRALRPLTEPGCAYDPAFSDDGALAWTGCGGGILADQLWVHDRTGAADVLDGLDLGVSGFDWQGKSL